MDRAEDSRKIEDLVEKYGDDVLRICFVYTKDYAAAQDLFQETFIKVYKNLKNFRGDSSEKTWIIRIAINVCKDYLKSAWIKRFIFLDEIKENSSTDVEGLVIDEIKKHEVIKAVLSLPSKYREVILLYYYFDFNTIEIAKTIGISETAVRSRLKRARDQLKNIFNEGEVVDYEG
ncbi:sigma-70 family RNA polymerase sigma factor [Caloramator sp. Dgby_cultured_2]|uniref:sigma-70 family RNA polymerase sigma factor n=1 Tax=Caloramator sp. Dgby_cultured_2 TaxID=3029174 RepID=UPI00237E789F|nr:sigma-70 family RNA polymerase sigma factor [Caloramator sp. Dgby_cultured_2]WDU84330.1 sigma-70 family RNA polymerase sigma factor [Caloramator sp. Dgby_cultured_2]